MSEMTLRLRIISASCDKSYSSIYVIRYLVNLASERNANLCNIYLCQLRPTALSNFTRYTDTALLSGVSSTLFLSTLLVSQAILF